MSKATVREGHYFRQSIDHCSDQVKNYIASVSSEFCPFIEPSSKFNTLFFSEYLVDVDEQDSLCKSIFYLGPIHAEILRANRLRMSQMKESLLLCENVVFEGKFLDQIDGADVFRWPHWLLKILYTDRSLLFGKFWKGEKARSQDGRLVTIPPVHILSIRCAVKPIDARFFEKTPELLEAHISSFDDSTTVFDFKVSPTSKKVVNLIAALDPCSLDKSSVLELYSECKRTHIFQDCLREIIKRENALYPNQSMTQSRFQYLLENNYA